MLTLKDPSLLKTQNFVDGKWVAGGAGTIDVTNPATGEIVSTTANGDAADADRAGIPKGVISVVAGSNSSEIGKVLTMHDNRAARE